jgi:hypothetical protein
MTVLLLILLIFVVLLAVEWKRRSKTARAGAVVLALVLLDFAHANPYGAARTIMGLPRAERVLEVANWGPLDDYHSGVLTMRQAMERDLALVADAKHLGIGVLVWLALIPSFRREAAPSNDALARGRSSGPEPVP